MLEKMVAQRPDDPFPRYGLAMELRKQGEAERAKSAFAELIEAHPDYVPSYLMAGQHLVANQEPEAAARVLKLGVEAASRAGDDHARSELEAALDDLGC